MKNLEMIITYYVLIKMLILLGYSILTSEILMNIENLVLSGGGIKGYTYIGVMKALEEKNIKFKINNFNDKKMIKIIKLLKKN